MILEAKNAPNLTDLMVRFVSRPIDAATLDAQTAAYGEVEPHEVAVGFRADPRLAWNEGLAVYAALGISETLKASAPSDWSAVVVRQGPIAAQPFALAGYPQRVRDLTALVQAADLSKLRPTGESHPPSASLRAWATKQVDKQDFAESLLAAAVLRAACDFEQSGATLESLRNQMPAHLSSAFINEEAALYWAQGEAAKAVALWESLPETAPVLFNRGMAALFMNATSKARDLLKKAVALIPETDGWHHLGRLYLALAEMRTV